MCHMCVQILYIVLRIYDLKDLNITSCETNRIIGIISKHCVSSDNIDAKLNFAIPPTP